MTARHRVLDGLPPYGPMPEQFSATGQGMHREGFVVEFTLPDAPSWIGNFQRGMTSLDVVIASRRDTTATVSSSSAWPSSPQSCPFYALREASLDGSAASGGR